MKKSERDWENQNLQQILTFLLLNWFNSMIKASLPLCDLTTSERYSEDILKSSIGNVLSWPFFSIVISISSIGIDISFFVFSLPVFKELFPVSNSDVISESMDLPSPIISEELEWEWLILSWCV